MKVCGVSLMKTKLLAEFVPESMRDQYKDPTSHVKPEHIGAWPKGKRWTPRKEDGTFIYDVLEGIILDPINERSWRCIKGRPWESGSVWLEIVFVEQESNARLGVSKFDMYN